MKRGGENEPKPTGAPGGDSPAEKQAGKEGAVVPDWAYLPAGVEGQSLWAALHDAELRTVRADALERSAVMEFDLPHFGKHSGLPEGLVFGLHFSGVRSIRASVFAQWPGPPPVTRGLSYDEQNRLVQEYQAKGREESLAWPCFETDVAKSGFIVLHADMACGDDETTIRLEGMLESDRWCTLFLRAEAISSFRGDGVAFTVEELLNLGEAYWEAFDR